MNNIKKLGATNVKFIDGDRSDKYPSRNEFQNEGVLFLNAESIKTGRITKNTANFITEQKFNSISKGRIQRHDILMTTRGNGIGDVAYVDIPDKGLINAQMLILRSGEDQSIEPRYLYWFLKTNFAKDQIQIFSSGSAQPQIPIRDLKHFPILLPERSIQKKIAAILATYDDLIEINKKRIEASEKLAEELYKEWFVRLRFPNYKTIGIEKGVPSGWRVGKISDLGKTITGKTPPTNEARFYGTEYPFIKTPDMHNKVFIINTEENLSEDGYRYQKSQAIPKGAICVSCIGTGGVVAIASQPSQTNQQIHTLVPYKDFYLEWAYYTLKGMKETIELYGYTGSTMTNLSKGKFENLKILIPAEKALTEFNKATKPLFDMILNQQMTINNITSTRDKLLTRLMNGKISTKTLDITFPPSMNNEDPNG